MQNAAKKNLLMLCHYLSPSQIMVFSGNPTKEEVISQLLDKLCEQSHFDNVQAVKDAVWQREKEGRTVLENGLAIPHARLAGLNEIKACLGVISEGCVDSAENVKVHLVLLFLSPQEQFEAHLQMLAKISRVFQDANFTDELKKVTSADEAFALIQKQERI